jgi:predicted nucleic-acid-binding protein
MRAVDANVLVRLIARDDARQVAAAEAYVASGGWVSHLVLAETIWVLTSVYERGRAEVGSVVDGLLRHQTLTLQDADVVEAALQDFRASRKGGFSDCLLVRVARKAGHVPLGTFDRELSRLAGTERL